MARGFLVYKIVLNTVNTDFIYNSLSLYFTRNLHIYIYIQQSSTFAMVYLL